MIKKIVSGRSLSTAAPHACPEEALDAALRDAAETGDWSRMIAIISRARHVFPETIKHVIDDRLLLINAIKASDKKAIAELIKAGADVNVCDANGRTPLHAAVSTDSKIVRFLLNHGANPNVKDNFLDTPLHAASNRQASDACAYLLAYGARPFEVGPMGETPLMVAGYTNTMALQLYATAFLQVNHRKTGGLSSEMYTPLLKKSMVRAIAPLIPKKDRRCMTLSLTLDDQLMSPFNPMPAEEKKHRLYRLIKALPDNGFIWLSSGTHDHAIDMVVRRNAAGNISLNLSNRGLGADRFHKTDEAYNIYHKTIQFNPPDHLNAWQDKHKFETQLADSIVAIADRAASFEPYFGVDEFYEYVEHCLTYRPYLGRFSEERSDQGQPLPPQFSDNCVTMSMLGALGLIYPDKTRFDTLKQAWIESLKTDMKQLAPVLRDAHFSQMLANAESWSPGEWMHFRGTVLKARASSPATPATHKPKLYGQALYYFSKALNTFKKIPKPQRDRDYLITIYRLKQDISACKHELSKERYTETSEEPSP